MTKRQRRYKCPDCGAWLKPLRYFVNTKNEKAWKKVAYYCPKEDKIFKLDEIEGGEEE